MLRAVLARDGLDIHPLVLLGYVSIWEVPGWTYDDILRVYAEYVDDAPERVHAELCRRLLMAAKDIGPAAYLAEVRKEVERIEDRIPVEQGSRVGSVGIDTGEQVGNADCTCYRAPDR